MRKSNTQTISEVLKEYIRSLQIDGKLKEVELIKEWENILGKSVAQRTESLYIKKKILYVHLKSSVVRNELMMLRNSIKNRLNEIAGETLIEDIVLR